MYIWIFLATIMVALSFLNLSQRPDKDNTINEVKAATLVNKFKAEHTAVVKAAKCEILKDTDTQGWFTDNMVSPFPPAELDPESMNFGYTSYTDNLPIGYVEDDSFAVKHYVYCFEKQIETATSNNRVSCRDKNYNYVYVVSYAEIPPAWFNKEDATPMPILSNMISKSAISATETIYGVGAHTIYGWTQCNGSGDNFECSFKGNNARVNAEGKYGKDDNKAVYTILTPDSLMWKDNADLISVCSGTSCFFAYDRIDRTFKKECNSLFNVN